MPRGDNRIKLEPGDEFHFLTVVGPAPSRSKCAMYFCDCRCGRVNVPVRARYLVNKKTKSCGCLRKSGANWRGHGGISSTYWSRLKYDAAARDLAFSVTIEQAWDKFLTQGGTCALTGVELVFDRNRQKAHQTASFDRIDSDKGYVLDNVQWVHRDINMMKRDIPQTRFIEWCRKVSSLAA